MQKNHKRSNLRRRKEIRTHDVFVRTKKGRIINIEHPVYVFLEKGSLLIYVTITHSDKVKDRLVVKLRQNPNPKDKRNSYYVAEVKEDVKHSFGHRKHGWIIHPDDDLEIRKLYSNKKR